MLLCASPFIHLALGHYIKIFLVWGGCLLIRNLVKDRAQYKNMDTLLLLLFLISYGITILINRQQNLSSNISEWLYMTVIFMVLFHCDRNTEPQVIHREIQRILWCFLGITFFLSICSLTTFVFSIQGHVTYNDQWVYYGMFENRLWGMYNPSTGSALNTLSILMSVGCLLFRDSGKSGRKPFLASNMAVQYICLLLTSSRTAFYALLIGLGIQGFLYGLLPRTRTAPLPQKKGKEKHRGRWDGRCFLLFILLCGALALLANPIRNSVAYVPGVVNYIKGSLFDSSEDEETSDSGIEKESVTRMETLEERPGGLLNGRLELWTAGWETFQESPWFGITCENIPDRVAENLEDDYWLNDLKRGGVHNSWLTILLSSGIAGAGIFILFLLRLILRCLRFAFSRPIPRESGIVICPLSVMVVQMIMECFESRILYQVNVFYLLFWSLAGYSLYFCHQAAITDTGKEPNGF